ncbi:MAG: AAA domain-containing protein [Gammaproteobacteria bacterium]|nr:AAA domain-containing protein [Gammaproteobacteria bacterium]MYK43763.1 AAA domain-containing protein [Gammaproteobacteria bacterium]
MRLKQNQLTIANAISKAKKGDILLVRSKNRTLGIGVVHRNDYAENFDPANRLHVAWINKEPSEISKNLRTSEIFSQSEEIENVFRKSSAYNKTWKIMDELRDGNGDEDLSPNAGEIKEPLNQILFGPPGTGKTWQSEQLAVKIVEGKQDSQTDLYEYLENGQIQFITFHQNYDYGDFIEGLRPVLNESNQQITYELHLGVFKSMCIEAERFPDDNFVLIIDEINRGNIAKIFGELITLIEKSRRGKTSATLPYSNEQLTVPKNLFLIGTMNTADRSIQLLDTALRRRFEFVELMPDPNHDLVNSNCDGVNLKILLTAMNERIASLLDRERQIGHTYFFDLKNVTDLKRCFQKKVLPLLQEYFYDDWEKIDMVLGKNGFIELVEVDQIVKHAMHGPEDGQRYEKLDENDPDWDRVDCYKNIYENTKPGNPS